MMIGTEVNQALADMLGVQWRGRKVIGFDLHCAVGKLPELTVHELLLPTTCGVDFESRRFDLVPSKFDLDGLCAQALERVNAFIADFATRASASLRVVA